MRGEDSEEGGERLVRGDGELGQGLSPASASAAMREEGAEAKAALEKARELNRVGQHIAAATLLPTEEWLVAFSATKLAEEIRSHATQAESALKVLGADEEGWTLSRDDTAGDRLRCLYKHEAGSAWYDFKFEGTVDSDLTAVMSVAREFDLISTWNKFILDTSILHCGGLLDLTVYGGIWLPWPMAARDFALSAHGHDLLEENGSVVVCLHSTDCPLEKLPAEAADRVRADMEEVVVRLEPLAEGAEMKTRVTIICHINPMMPGNIEAPSWVLKWVLRTMTPFMFAQANTLVANIMRGADAALLWRERMARAPLPSPELSPTRSPLDGAVLAAAHSLPVAEGNPELYQLLRQREDESRARLAASGSASKQPLSDTARAAAAAKEEVGKAARMEAAAGEASEGPSHGWEVDEDELEACWLDPSRALRQEAEAAAAAAADGGGPMQLQATGRGPGPGPLPGGRM